MGGSTGLAAQQGRHRGQQRASSDWGSRRGETGTARQAIEWLAATVEIKGHCATVSWKDGMPEHTAGITTRETAERRRMEKLVRRSSVRRMENGSLRRMERVAAASPWAGKELPVNSASSAAFPTGTGA